MLSLQEALSTVSYVCDGVKYERKTFISAPDQVLVLHIGANKPGSVSFGVNLAPALNATVECTDDSQAIYGNCPVYKWKYNGSYLHDRELVYGQTDDARGIGYYASLRVACCPKAAKSFKPPAALP